MRALLSMLFILAGLTMANATGNGLITKTSAHSVSATVEKLTNAIENAGAKVIAVVDHAAAAEKAGLELAPATLVIFGNPLIGTPIMQDNIVAGLDLPIRVLVFEDARETKLTYLEPSALAERHSISGAKEALAKMTGALDKLTDAASK